MELQTLLENGAQVSLSVGLQDLIKLYNYLSSTKRLESNEIPENKRKDFPDNMNIDQAKEWLNSEKGYPIEKSTIYKLRHLGEIPCHTFGKRLVFSRKELEIWLKSKMSASGNIELDLAKSANRKNRRA